MIQSHNCYIRRYAGHTGIHMCPMIRVDFFDFDNMITTWSTFRPEYEDEGMVLLSERMSMIYKDFDISKCKTVTYDEISFLNKEFTVFA